MKLVVVEDALASNAPPIQLLNELNMQYILGCKVSEHKFLFEWVETSKQTKRYQVTDDQGSCHEFRYLSGVPLNDTHFDLAVNVVQYTEQRANGKTQRFSWVKDLPVIAGTVNANNASGSRRWRIENETFNTLKNHG